MPGDNNIGETEKIAGVRLAPDFSFAETPDGARVEFTRSERRWRRWRAVRAGC